MREHCEQSGNTHGDELTLEVLGKLSSEGYPVTAQRRALVGLILAHDRRFTAEELLAEAQAQAPRIGRATVFRTLELLTRLGYLGRVGDGERLAYAVCGAGHHHHLVCSSCGQVLHFNGCPIDGLLRELEQRTGYHIRDHRVEMAGLCPACQS